MQTYRYGHESLLEAELDEVKAVIYGKNNCQLLKGSMSEFYMAAYNTTTGFVGAIKAMRQKEGPETFNTPKENPVVVVARFTRVMLGDRILEMAKSITGDPKVGYVLGA
ncbi:unnamed protein product [Euphydryas editha]|uniref:Uncharacterized protein n=1 Tax=Euphydryas editha TaxID=104508 RepID=A0AAU9V2U4_EUPED|nr:unnamed protein product [Euphydryas editha]